MCVVIPVPCDMFKRLSKANALREQGGEDQEHVSLDAAIDHDSPSEEEGMDEAEDRESAEDDEDAESDENDSDDSDTYVESVEGEEDDDDDEDEEGDEFTVAHAIENPIYIDDEAPGSVIQFRCVSCPILILKNNKSMDVHLESKNHKRRHARFIAFAKEEMEREGDRVLHIDPRTLVDLLEDQRAQTARQATQQQAQQALAKSKHQSTQKRKHDDTYIPRLERRKIRRAARREKRASMRDGARRQHND